MSEQNLNEWGIGNDQYVRWCLSIARREVEQDFPEVRRMQSITAKNYMEFSSSLEPMERSTLADGLVFRGLLPDHYDPRHRTLWEKFREHCLRQDAKLELGRSRRWGLKGANIIRYLKERWNADLLGHLTSQEKTELRAELTDHDWKLETWLVFDRTLLTYYRLYEPQGKTLVQRSSFLGWIGLSGSGWDDARRGSETKVAEEAIRILEDYSKRFLLHFSDPEDTGSE